MSRFIVEVEEVITCRHKYVIESDTEDLVDEVTDEIDMKSARKMITTQEDIKQLFIEKGIDIVEFVKDDVESKFQVTSIDD